MRILITGGAGYIGTRLVEALLGEKDVDEIVVLDLRPPRASDPRIVFRRRSVTEDLTDLFTDPARPLDSALHLAWCVDPLRDPALQRDICVGGTRRFLDGCAAGRVGHVLFMSSATAYGANPAHAEPVSEFEPLKDEFHFQYSAEKREAESLCRRFAEDRPGTLLQIVRPAIVGGPNVGNFIFRALDRPVSFIAVGHDPELQFVHEEDIAAALVAILRSRLPGAFNVTGDGRLKLSECYRLLGVRRVVPLPLPVLRALVATAWRLDLRRFTESPAGSLWFSTYPWLISNRRLKTEVGFAPRFGCREVLDCVKQRPTGAPGGPPAEVTAAAVGAPQA